MKYLSSCPSVLGGRSQNLHTFMVMLLCAGIVCCPFSPVRAAGQLLFNGKDLTGWRLPTGEWKVIGGVELNAEDNKQFVTRPGKGVMVNNPKGKTVNLISDFEHGDVEAHVEFV